MVSLSPWPILSSVAVFTAALNSLIFMKGEGSVYIYLISWAGVMLISASWWRDVIRESTYQGCHTKEVVNGLIFGVCLFILSEVMFFFSFFFTFFSSALSPDVEIGMNWPPLGVQPVSFSLIPMLNSIILLSSGVSVTWAHHAILCSQKQSACLGGLFTVLLGSVFIAVQAKEFVDCPFTICDSIFGSVFFIVTGFHGLHVIIGTAFLSYEFIRCWLGQISNRHHFGVEAAAWYWHFVDVVWLFLFVSVYWWGS